MRNFNLSALLWSAIVVMFMLQSCEHQNQFAPSVSYTKGTKVQVKEIIKTDSVIVYITDKDTIYVPIPCDHDTTPQDPDTVYVPCDKPHGKDTTIYIHDTVPVSAKFRCLKHSEQGEIILVDWNDNVYTFVGTKISARTSGDVFFKESAYDFVLENTTSTVNNGEAKFTVSKGQEAQTLKVGLDGVTFILANGELVELCGTVSVTANISGNGVESVNGEKYNYVDIQYTIVEVNEGVPTRYGHAVQRVYAPVQDEYSLECVIENNLSHVDGAILVMKGYMNGDLVEDRTFNLTFRVACDEKVSVFAKDTFNVLSSGTTTKLSENLVNQSKTLGEMQLSYNECEYIYTHNVSASENIVSNKITVTCRNNFVVSYKGKTAEITVPIEVNFEKAERNGNAVKANNEVKQNFVVTYKGTYGNNLMTDKAFKEIEEVLQVICFDGEQIAWANRSISFNQAIGKALIFDCVLTQCDGGGYKYHYRQKGTQNWETLEVGSQAEYDKLIENAKKDNYGLANYYDPSGWKPGVVFSTDVNEVVIHYNYENGNETIAIHDYISLRTLLNGIGVDKAVLATAVKVSGNIYVMVDGEEKIYFWVEQ